MNIQRILQFFCLIGLLGACSGQPQALVPLSELAPIRSQPIFVVNHGRHTGLIVPGPSMHEALPELALHFDSPVYYEIGWGDRDFYQAQEVTSGLALQALFWSKGAAVHVVALFEQPEQYFADEPVVSTCLSKNELASLQSFLVSNFYRTATGSIIALGPGNYGDSAFYRGEGRYYILNTCNNWTAKALKSSGLKIQPFFKCTAGSIINFLEKHRRPCTS